MSPDLAVLIVAGKGEAEALARSLGGDGAGLRITIDGDGRGPLEALLRVPEPGEPPRPVPDLILIDASLPGLGVEALARIKSAAGCQAVTVVVLPTPGAQLSDPAGSVRPKPAALALCRDLVNSLRAGRIQARSD